MPTSPQARVTPIARSVISNSTASRLACEEEIERAVVGEGQVVLGWRDVPVDRAMPMSPTVRAKEPVIRQIFVGRGADVMVADALERKLYVIRKTASAAIENLQLKYSKEYYVPSMSSRTVVYKGLLLADQVGKYYLDLQDERVVSALALVHQRFSTNTFPTWDLAHPFRLIAHNGEINTLRGNVNWMHARQGIMSSPLFGERLKDTFPVIEPDTSDSGNFDNALEHLLMTGRSLQEAIMMMIPEAWQNAPHMSDQKKAFYEFQSCLMEPWDGPASLIFSDGRYIGGMLDRNGLRPSRYLLTTNDLIVMGSEAGVLQFKPEEIKKKGRLKPGKMLLVDTKKGKVYNDSELKAKLAGDFP